MTVEIFCMVSANAQLASYQSWAQASGAATETIRLRRHHLLKLAKLYAPVPLLDLTTPQLVDYLSQPSWAAETRKSARSALRSFYRWAADMEVIARDPSRLLPNVRIPVGKPRPTPEIVFANALRVAPARERLMVMLAGYAGLRRAEIARVHTDDIQNGYLRIMGKGGAIRRIPLYPDLVAELRDVSPGFLFPGQDHGHLSPNHVGVLVKRALGPNWSAHTLRHRFASKAYLAQRDLLAVQSLLGHSKPETTKRYVEIPTDALRAAVLAVG